MFLFTVLDVYQVSFDSFVVQIDATDLITYGTVLEIETAAAVTGRGKADAALSVLSASLAGVIRIALCPPLGNTPPTPPLLSDRAGAPSPCRRASTVAVARCHLRSVWWLPAAGVARVSIAPWATRARVARFISIPHLGTRLLKTTHFFFLYTKTSARALLVILKTSLGPTFKDDPFRF